MPAKKNAQSAPRPSVPDDKLEGLQAKAAEMRDLEREIEDLQGLIEEKNKRLWTIAHEELPSLMMDAGVDHVGLPPTGNLPGYDAKMTPFYRANIAASWDQDKRAKAFAYLEEIGAGDLIKTEIGIALPREQREQARQLLEQLSAYSPSVKEAVHTGTLTSWMKEQLQDGQSVDLELIGGETGTTVKLKPRKKD
jgi:hypothetical protein